MRRPSDLLALLAALMGACGVGLAAASTHAGGGELGRTAAEFCVLHAAALMGATASARESSAGRARRLLIAGAGLFVGTALFSADLARLGFADARLFPFAAPMGGSLMILSWAGLALAFALPERSFPE